MSNKAKTKTHAKENTAPAKAKQKTPEAPAVDPSLAPLTLVSAFNALPNGDNPFSRGRPRQLHCRVGNRAAGRIIQTKLKIGAPDDKYEREADAVADRVMRMELGQGPGARSVEEQVGGREKRYQISDTRYQNAEVRAKNLSRESGSQQPTTDNGQLIQRDESGSEDVSSTGDAFPEFRLRPISLLDGFQNRGPSIGNFSQQLHLDPLLRFRLARQYLNIFSPEAIAETIRRLNLHIPQPNVLPLGNPPPSTPSTPPNPPPSPTGEVEEPKEGSARDLIGAIAATEPFKGAINNLQLQGSRWFERNWQQIGTGGRIGVISTGVVIAGSLLGGLIASPNFRRRFFTTNISPAPNLTGDVAGHMIFNDLVVPIPGISTFGLELNYQPDSEAFLVGVHLNVGKIFPKSWGFGSGGFTAFGGPLASEEELPGAGVLSRKEINPTYDNQQPTTDNGQLIQRKCAACKEGSEPCPNCAAEEQVSGKREAAVSAKNLSPDDVVQRTTASSQQPAASGQLESRINRLKSGGQPLPKSARNFFEPRFGADFSKVRIHTGSQAAGTAQAINAKAFTTGNNIVFNRGQYSPHTSSGRHLLARELTHTIQQGKGIIAKKGIQLQRGPDISKGNHQTFYIGTSKNTRAFAIQVGLEPGNNRVTLKASAVTKGLLNPALASRMIPLSIHKNVPRNPKIIRETESELPSTGHQKIIELSLSQDNTIPKVIVVLRYSKSKQWLPHPSKSISSWGGYWKKQMVESGWLQVSDGFNEMTVNFTSDNPGSFYSTRFHPMMHPRLGFGFRDIKKRRFYAYPRGKPSFNIKSLVRTVVHMLPVIGTLVMIGEALVGRDIWGQRISTTERAILGAGALLSVIGPIFRAGKAGIAVATATKNLSTVANMSRVKALHMILSARNLTAVERTKLSKLAVKVRTGKKLTQADITLSNRILGKLAEPARVRAIRAEVAATTGTARKPGRFTDLATRTSADETRVGKALAKNLKADVVRVKEATTSGTRTGDYLINNKTAELFTPKSASLNNLLSAAAKKHKQGGIMVIDMTRTTIPQNQIVGSAGRLFGRPEFGDVSKLIYVHGQKVVKVVTRPKRVGNATGSLIRGGASQAGQKFSE